MTKDKSTKTIQRQFLVVVGRFYWYIDFCYCFSNTHFIICIFEKGKHKVENLVCIKHRFILLIIELYNIIQWIGRISFDIFDDNVLYKQDDLRNIFVWLTHWFHHSWHQYRPSQYQQLPEYDWYELKIYRHLKVLCHNSIITPVNGNAIHTGSSLLQAKK